MDGLRKYPIGIQTFSKIRETGCVYVDKTAYIHAMTHCGAGTLFLSRPRRFGKSLLISTMQAYFEGRRELFEGLAVEGLETAWERHPVLRFDMSSVKSTDHDVFCDELSRLLRLYELAYGCCGEGEPFSSRVDALIKAAHDRSGTGVVLLVDEYDAPLLSVLHMPEQFERCCQTMREFYSPLKANDQYLRFTFLTGITKFSQLSIFSELNNILNISMLPQYAGVCGIIEDELRGVLASDVAVLAQRLGAGVEETYGLLRRKYDGYRFCAESPGIYNPFSLMSVLGTGRLSSFWFESGTPTFLVDSLRANDVYIPDLETCYAEPSTFDAPAERLSSPVALLYQSGYLTIRDYDPLSDIYTLGIPNEEVATGLYKSLLPSYVTSDKTAYDGFLFRFLRSVRDGDIEEALSLLQAFLAGVPYDLSNKSERDFQTMLFIVFRLVGAHIDTEVRTASGRIDVVMRCGETMFVMELKYDRSAREALEQIDQKGYLLPYAAEGSRLVKVGVSFSSEKRTIDEWIVG